MDTTTKNNLYTTKLLALLLMVSLLSFSGVALAQETIETSLPADDSSYVNENGTLATTTDEIDNSKDEPWFTVEELSGNVSQGDFVVGPGRIEIEAKPGDTIVRYITVANRVSDDRVFNLEVEDIIGSRDLDKAVTLLGEEAGPYTLKDYISFPESSFKLALGERANIPVTITIPEDAEPGGLYGSVLVSTIKINKDQGQANAPRSPIIARVGTLFFVTIPGEVIKEGEVKQMYLPDKKWWYESGPIKLSILYENTGSVHLNPYGELRIHNIFGEEVGFLELKPWFALPDSLRSRDITWDRELLFGRYTATAFINRGYDDIVDEVSVSFWVLPWKVLGTIFLVVFIIFFSLRAFFRTFEFKRKG